MIKVIISDLAGVLLSGYDPYLCAWIAKKFNKKLEEIQPIIDKHFTASESGEYTEYECFEFIIKELNLDIDPLELQNKRMEFTKINPKMKKFILQLRKKYLVVFATNSSAEEFARNHGMFKLDKIFQYGKASYQFKVRKNKKEFFEKYLNILKVEPSEIVFIDDSERNIAPARELGIQTIKFENFEQLKKEFEERRII